MKTIENYFDQNPRATGWLHKMGLKTNELVLVEGHTYRYSVENAGRDHVLTPAEPLASAGPMPAHLGGKPTKTPKPATKPNGRLDFYEVGI